jgi:RND family efflux transporter MFP subunit
MKKHIYHFLLPLILVACKSKTESISPTLGPITESVYASGTIESDDQYQVFPSVNGIIQQVYVTEGDIVKTNSKLFSIFNETSRINRENAELNAQYSDFESNSSKLSDLKLNIELAKNKMQNDSLMLSRQKALFEKEVITASQLEQSQLNFQNSKTTYLSSQLKYIDLKKQLRLTDQQSKNNVRLTSKMENDFFVTSDVKGKVYSILKKKGEMVSIQTPIAIIGSSNSFKIILQVDEYDIIRIKKGLEVIVSLDSYKGKSFEAVISKIDPIMNERSKTFTIEAVFTKQPPTLYPNLSLEANIVIQKKEKAITIPRNYLIEEKFVLLKNNKRKYVKIGLKDYQKVEIISGLTQKDKIFIPAQ